MRNLKFVYLITGLALASVVSTRAEDAKPTERPSREELREKFQNLSPEEREAKRKEFAEKRGEEMKKMAKEIGVDPEELKKLPEAERREKIRQAGEKKLAELQKKKTDGTITDSEKETLQRLEQRKKMIEQFRGEGRGPRTEAPKPSEKK